MAWECDADGAAAHAHTSFTHQGLLGPLHVKGVTAHVKGVTAHVKGVTAHVKGVTAHVKGVTAHVKGVTAHVKGVTAHVKGVKPLELHASFVKGFTARAPSSRPSDSAS